MGAVKDMMDDKRFRKGFKQGYMVAVPPKVLEEIAVFDYVRVNEYVAYSGLKPEIKQWLEHKGKYHHESLRVWASQVRKKEPEGIKFFFARESTAMEFKLAFT